MTGVEIDFVVTDCIAALKLYDEIFGVETIEATAGPRGQNEAVFTLYGSRFHMLDENPDFMLIAPKEDSPTSIWFNVLVEDIAAVHTRAIHAGAAEIQPVNEMPAMGASNSMFKDPFGHVWMLHQIHREVSFEDRVKAMEEMG